MAPARAQAPAPSPGKSLSISLDECVQRALEKNLDLRIQQFQPQYSRLDLSSAYADWDPTLTGRVRESFTRSEGRQVPGEFNARGSETTVDHFETGIGGNTPTGLRYDVLGSMDYVNGFEFIGSTNGPDSKTYTPNVGIALQQPLLRNLLIDRTRWNIAVSRQNIRSSQQGVRGAAIRVVTDVATAYYDLIFANENVKVQEKALELAVTSLSQNQTRVKVGAMAPLEEKQAEAQVARSRSDLIAAQQGAARAQNTLKSLITDDFASMADLILEPSAALSDTPFPFNKQDSWHKGLTLRPDVLQSLAELEKQKITIRFQRNQIFPQLDLTGSYGYAGLDSRFSPALGDISGERNPRYSYGVVLSVPLSNRAARNSLKQSRLRQEELLLRHKQLEQQVLISIDNAVLEAQAAYQRVNSTRENQTYAEAALNAEQKKYENGKSTSFVVLQLQRDLTSAKSQAIGAITDYNKAIVRLAEAEGSTLDQRAIRIEFR